MKGNKYFYPILYLFLLPIFLAFFFEFVFKSITLSRVFNLLENLLFAILIILFSFLITNLKYKKLFFLITIPFFNFCLLFETLYYYLFDNFLTASAIFVVIESNSNEIKDFLSVHVDRCVMGLILIFLINIIYVLTKGK